MEQKVKDIRVELDGLTQLIKSLKPKRLDPINGYEFEVSITYELENAFRSTQLSKMWLGKVLKELGTANPYPDSKTPFRYIVTQDLDSTHGTIPKGTLSIKHTDDVATFKIGDAEVSFYLIKENENFISKVINEKIEPTADKSYVRREDTTKWQEFTYVQKVKWLRSELEKIEKELREYYDLYCNNNIIEEPLFYVMRHMLVSIECCIEAGMWLGMELGRVRDMEEPKKK